MRSSPDAEAYAVVGIDTTPVVEEQMVPRVIEVHPKFSVSP